MRNRNFEMILALLIGLGIIAGGVAQWSLAWSPGLVVVGVLVMLKGLFQ